MHSKSFREFTIAGSLIVTMTSAVPVLATSTGLQKLGIRDTAEDIFTFTCPDGTVSVQANVEDLIPPVNVPARMRVMLLRKDRIDQKTDVNPPNSAGESEQSIPTPSPMAVSFQGPGLYYLFFLKTASGKEEYRGSAVCVVDGVKVNPEGWTRTQNQ